MALRVVHRDAKEQRKSSAMGFTRQPRLSHGEIAADALFCSLMASAADNTSRKRASDVGSLIETRRDIPGPVLASHFKERHIWILFFSDGEANL